MNNFITFGAETIKKRPPSLWSMALCGSTFEGNTKKKQEKIKRKRETNFPPSVRQSAYIFVSCWTYKKTCGWVIDVGLCCLAWHRQHRHQDPIYCAPLHPRTANSTPYQICIEWNVYSYIIQHTYVATVSNWARGPNGISRRRCYVTTSIFHAILLEPLPYSHIAILPWPPIFTRQLAPV